MHPKILATLTTAAQHAHGPTPIYHSLVFGVVVSLLAGILLTAIGAALGRN
jgi:hypothetical protein